MNRYQRMWAVPSTTNILNGNRKLDFEKCEQSVKVDDITMTYYPPFQMQINSKHAGEWQLQEQQVVQSREFDYLFCHASDSSFAIIVRGLQMAAWRLHSANCSVNTKTSLTLCDVDQPEIASYSSRVASRNVMLTCPQTSYISKIRWHCSESAPWHQLKGILVSFIGRRANKVIRNRARRINTYQE